VKHLQGSVLDIYEKEESLERIIDQYEMIVSFFKENPEIGYGNIFCINGEQKEKEVLKDVLDVLKFFDVI